MASSTARVISLAVLLLACAPLASLYAVFASNFVEKPSNDRKRISNDLGTGRAPTFKNLSSFHTGPQDPNSILEELWAALFRESRETTLMLTSLRTVHVHHCSILLPWCISLLLGVVIPFTLSLVEFLRPEEASEDDDDEDDYPWVSRCNRRHYDKRMKILTNQTKDYRKIVNYNDIVPDEYDDEGLPRWKLPRPGEPCGTETRSVDGMCAICLGFYACGDEVLWSSNPNCPHVYHEDCILLWLVRRRKKCPCCRQPFLAKSE